MGSEDRRRILSSGKPKLPNGRTQIKAEDKRRAKSAGLTGLPASNRIQVRAEDNRKAKNPANPNASKTGAIFGSGKNNYGRAKRGGK